MPEAEKAWKRSYSNLKPFHSSPFPAKQADVCLKDWQTDQIPMRNRLHRYRYHLNQYHGFAQQYSTSSTWAVF